MPTATTEFGEECLTRREEWRRAGPAILIMASPFAVGVEPDPPNLPKAAVLNREGRRPRRPFPEKRPECEWLSYLLPTKLLPYTVPELNLCETAWIPAVTS